MTEKLREAAILALDALDSDDPTIQTRAALSLRAALAEPEEKLLSIHRLDQWLKVSLAGQKPMFGMNPQKREWVGLTDEEVMILNRKSYDAQIGLLPLTFYRAIEAKLREKNT